MYNKYWTVPLVFERKKVGSKSELIGEKPKWIIWMHRNLSANHCEECLRLDGCWFLEEDLMYLPDGMSAKTNEQIKAEYEKGN